MLHVFWIFFPLLPGYALQRRGRDLQGTLTPSFARIVWNLRPGYQQQQQQVPFDRFNMERLDFSFLPFFIDECVRRCSHEAWIRIASRYLHPYFKENFYFFNWKFSTKCIEEGNSKKIGLNVKREGTVLSYCRVKIHSFVDKICRNKLNENTISLISCRYATLRPDIELHEIQHFFS